MAARKPPAPREREVLAQVLEWLALHRVMAWRNNSGGRLLPGHGGRGQFVRWGVPGSGDVFVLLPPNGKLVSIEVKRPGAKARPAQEEWMRRVRDQGAGAGVVASVEELEALLRAEGWRG